MLSPNSKPCFTQHFFAKYICPERKLCDCQLSLNLSAFMESDGDGFNVIYFIQNFHRNFASSEFYKQMIKLYNEFSSNVLLNCAVFAAEKYVRAFKLFGKMVGWMAVTIFTIVIGLSIVGIQLWLALFLTIVDWSLKVFLSTKIGTQNICASIQTARTKITGFGEDLADKFFNDLPPCLNENRHLHIFVDIISGVVDHFLGLNTEVDPVDSTVSDRLRRIGKQMFSAVVDKKTNLLRMSDAVQKHIEDIVQYLDNSFTLVKTIRAQQSWFDGKLGNMQESVANLKAFVEKEAKTLHQKPEEILLSIICQLSSSLIEKLDFLVQNNEEILNENLLNNINSVKNSLVEFDKNVQNMNNLNELSDEVLVVMHAKINEFSDRVCRNKIFTNISVSEMHSAISDKNSKIN